MVSKIDFLFYSPDIEKTQTLTFSEGQHAVKVLRKKHGDMIQVTDGKGGWFACQITHPDPKECRVRIVTAQYEYGKPEREIYLAISPTKSSDRIEYFLEKSIEIGISGVFFLKTQNTYPKKVNMERMEKIAVSAMKQSLKAYKPELFPLMAFNDFLEKVDQMTGRYLAHLAEDASDIMDVPLGSQAVVAIGPEGDFSQDEVRLAKERGWQTVFLGRNRLRTETAGVFAATILNARKLCLEQ